MIYLADTNVLLRFLHRTDPRHSIVWSAVHTLKADNQLRAASQNFIECWNVSTRPVIRNGFGITPQEADTLLQIAERMFPPLPDSAAVYREWRRLVVQYGVSGVQVHDAHLVATMLAHNITHILTFNTSDFARYAPEGIVAVDPATVC